MSVITHPRLWTPRSLTSLFLPHVFRRMRRFEEATGPSTEKVPIDAHENHLYIKRKNKKMTKAIRDLFRLNYQRPPEFPRGHVWSIATREWVDERRLKLEFVFPFSLGPTVAQEVSPRIQFRGAHNGMLIPPGIGNAYREWALLIVPPKHQRHQDIPESLLFKTLESETKTARALAYLNTGPAVRDLDGEPLEFRSQARLNVHSCYFHSCCAMWKKTFLEKPDRPAQEFWEVFQFRMDDLWGDWANRRSILRIFRPVELYSPEEIADRELTFKASRTLIQMQG